MAASIWKRALVRSLAIRPLGADDALGDAFLQAVGVAHGHHGFADFHRVGIAERNRLEFVGVDLEHGDVRVGVGADEESPACGGRR